MRRYPLVLAMVLGLPMAACTPFVHFRTAPGQAEHPVCEASSTAGCETDTLIRTPKYLLGFVEFDDLGWFWNRNQKEAVVQAVEDAARSQDLVVVVFAHGWNHNASVNDSNVREFREILARLADLERLAATKKCLPERQIVGVYMAWRGKAFRGAGHLPATLYNWSSFPAVKATGHRVGSEDAAELLSDLERVWRQANRTHGGERHANRLVVVGHSFGSAVVHGAVSRILAGRRIFLRDGNIDAASFGDLVVLVNPAIEASLLFPFEQARVELGRSETPDQFEFHPILAVLASQGDRPNKTLFPFGRRVTTFLGNHRDDVFSQFDSKDHFQGRARRTAVGQFEPTVSFLLCPVGEQRMAGSLDCTSSQPTKEAKQTRQSAETGPAAGSETEGIDWKDAPAAQLVSIQDAQALAQAFYRGAGEPGGRDDLPLSTATLFRRRPGPMTPYPIISVDARLIRDHNDIFSDFFAPFLIDFITAWAHPRPAQCNAELHSPPSPAPGG